jgi:hypothetical protein
MRLFQRNRVKPLLGIVPDNRDPKLNRQKPEPQFWETMKLLSERGLVDIAQHGYQHILVRTSQRAALYQTNNSRAARSEFAGYSYQEQLDRIHKGREIMARHGLATTYWFAPNHSFDLTTLNALKNAGFDAVSDGIALLPYHYRGLIFIPQQLWRPAWVPTGVFTICLHSNEITTREIGGIRQFLRTPARITSFDAEVRGFRGTKLDGIKNSLFKGIYRGARGAREVLRQSRLPAPETLRSQPPETHSTRMDRGSISSI